MGIARAFAFVVAANALAPPASATMWICSYPERGGVILVMDGLAFFEGHSGKLAHEIVVSDERRVIARYFNSVDVGDAKGAMASTISIDKKASQFSHSTRQGHDDVRHVSGMCRGYDDGIENSLPARTLRIPGEID